MLLARVELGFDVVVMRLIAVRMNSLVFRARQAYQVLKPIVVAYAVQMMDGRTARDRTVSSSPYQAVFELVFTGSDANQYVTALDRASTIPVVVASAGGTQSHVVTMDKSDGEARVSSTLSAFRNGSRRTATALTNAAGRFPALGRLGPSLGLHRMVCRCAAPVPGDEGLILSRVVSGRSRQLLAASAGTGLHGCSLSRLRNQRKGF